MAEYEYDPLSTEIKENGSNPRVFRARKYYRNLGIIGLSFSIPLSIGAGYEMWNKIPPQNNIINVAFACLMLLFIPCLSLWILLAYKYGYLIVQNETIIGKGVIFRKEIDLSSVKQARWNLVQGGGITLKSLTEKISIYFDNFELEERLWLIHHLQSHLPESVQQNWDLFCHKIAIPLRDYKPEKFKPPGADEVLLTRKRWDWYFVPFILLTIVLGIVAAWKFQLPRLLNAPVLPTILWLILRYGTPKRGMVSQRISADREFVKLWNYIAWWSIICLIIFVMLKLLKLPGFFCEFPGFIVMTLWTLVAYWRIFQSYNNQHKRDLKKAKAAVIKWDSKVDSQAKQEEVV